MSFRIFIVCIFLVSCTPYRMIETQLYFGQTRPNGSRITDAEWNDFKDNQISRVFTRGSTTIKATGTWYDPDTHKLISEPAYVVSCFYKKSALISRQIDSLRNLYKTMFNQQSILRVDKKVQAGF
jgi:hypothetical protein